MYSEKNFLNSWTKIVTQRKVSNFTNSVETTNCLSIYNNLMRVLYLMFFFISEAIKSFAVLTLMKSLRDTNAAAQFVVSVSDDGQHKGNLTRQLAITSLRELLRQVRSFILVYVLYIPTAVITIFIEFHFAAVVQN